MKKLVAAVVLALGIAGVVHAESTKSVVVVNIQQVLQDSLKVKAVNKKLQDEYKPRQDKLAEFQKKIQDALTDFNKNEATMSEQEKKDTQAKIDADKAEFLKQANQFQQELAQAQTASGKEVYDLLNKVIKEVAEKRGYGLVLDSQAVAFADKSLNVTQEVLDALK